MKDEVSKFEGVVETVTEEMTNIEGALNKEKAERKEENQKGESRKESGRGAGKQNLKRKWKK